MDAASGVVLAGKDDPLEAAAGATDRARDARRPTSSACSRRASAPAAPSSRSTSTRRWTARRSPSAPSTPRAASRSAPRSRRAPRTPNGTNPGVTVAANLPDGDVSGDAGGNSATPRQSRERQNFEVSETRRERMIAPGQVRRVSVAVMVDGVTTTDAQGVDDLGAAARSPRSRRCASWCSRRSASTPRAATSSPSSRCSSPCRPTGGALAERRLRLPRRQRRPAGPARRPRRRRAGADLLRAPPARRPPPGARDHRADRPARARAGPAASARTRPAATSSTCRRSRSPRSSGCATSSPAAPRTPPRCCAAGSRSPNPARSPPDHERLPPGDILPGLRLGAVPERDRAAHRHRSRGSLPPRLPRRPGRGQRGLPRRPGPADQRARRGDRRRPADQRGCPPPRRRVGRTDGRGARRRHRALARRGRPRPPSSPASSSGRWRRRPAPGRGCAAPPRSPAASRRCSPRAASTRWSRRRRSCCRARRRSSGTRATTTSISTDAWRRSAPASRRIWNATARARTMTPGSTDDDRPEAGDAGSDQPTRQARAGAFLGVPIEVTISVGKARPLVSELVELRRELGPDPRTRRSTIPWSSTSATG